MMSLESNQHQCRINSSTRNASVVSQDDKAEKNIETKINNVKVLENLKIKIGDAKKLTSGGKDIRNCYCSVQLDCEELFKTRVIEKTSCPFFQEDFEFDIPHNFTFLCFYLHEVLGDVLSKRDSVFAKVVIKKSELVECSGLDRWHPLVAVGNREEVQGQVYVDLKFESIQSLSQVACKEDLFKLVVRVPKCTGLFSVSGSCDPFVYVTLQGMHRSETKKSRVKKGITNPCFEDEFVFELNKANSLRRSWFDLTLGGSTDSKMNEQEQWALQTLKIAVHNAGTLGDVFMGEIKIPLSDVTPSHSGWYLLKSRSDKTSAASKEGPGSLRIKVTYTKDLVFPSETYYQLLNNILHSSSRKDLSESWPALIGAISSSRKQLVVAQHLVRIFLHQGKLLSLVVPLADAEISSTKNLHAIFRNSSFSSFTIEESLRLVGRSYLCKVLSVEVEKIQEEGKQCEIDPARLSLSNGVLPSRSVDSPSSNHDSLAPNRANLWKCVQSVLSAIVQSSPHCPALLCGVFNELRSSAATHFPDDLNARYRAVTNFLFLRFFCGALLCPRKYKLISSDLSPISTRTLTLVSMCLQHLCTLALPRPPAKNSAKTFMKCFLDEVVTSDLLERLKQFIDVVSSAPGCSSMNGPAVQTVEKVTLKEGVMVKRAQGRTFLLGRKNFKTRYFFLTNYELSYGKDKKSKPLCVIPVQEIKGVEELHEKSFRMANMFQVIQDGRVLYCKAGNSVEQKEWMDVLTKVCNCNSNRAQHYHPGAYIQGKYTWLPTSIRLNIDQDRDLERLYVILSNSHAQILALQEECGARSVYVGPEPKLNMSLDSEAESTDDGEMLQENSIGHSKSHRLPLESMDPQQTYRTLSSILDCLHSLDRLHSTYNEVMRRNSAKEGSKDKPYQGS